MTERRTKPPNRENNEGAVVCKPLEAQRELFTTAEATVYCGYKSTSALRKAKLQGLLVPVGRRGGRGTWMWRRSDLDRFLAGVLRVSVVPGRPGTPPQEDADGQNGLEYRWKHRVRPTRLPGIFKMQEGGHIARGRVTDPTTGRMKELKKVLPQSSAEEAFAWLEAERAKVRTGTVLAKPQKARFAAYAISVFERKAKTGELKSAATQSKWRDTLVHLVRGTHDGKGELAVPGFGELFVDQIQATHVERWKELMGGLLQAGQYSPNTANSWLGVLRVVLKSAARDYNLERIATDGVANFDASSHVTYSDEAPNALTPECAFRPS